MSRSDVLAHRIALIECWPVFVTVVAARWQMRSELLPGETGVVVCGSKLIPFVSAFVPEMTMVVRVVEGLLEIIIGGERVFHAPWPTQAAPPLEPQLLELEDVVFHRDFAQQLGKLIRLGGK